MAHHLETIAATARLPGWHRALKSNAFQRFATSQRACNQRPLTQLLRMCVEAAAAWAFQTQQLMHLASISPHEAAAAAAAAATAAGIQR
mmetsp:Transcript_9375/g.23841  ORF Transcript_9375/g.23841 Transcript_9375/m.23841 type:complete len:89 (-) Transcript_9375:692-958(-)